MSSILSWGGGGEKKTTTTSISSMKDQTTAVEGNVGTMFAAGSTTAMGGTAVHTEGGQNATTNLTVQGLSGPDVTAMIDRVLTSEDLQNTQSTTVLSDLTGSIASGLNATAAKLGEIVEAQKAPDQTTLNTLVPFALLGLFIYMFMRR